MPRVSLEQFLQTINQEFPNLKKHDETRLFSVLMQCGVGVEFDFDADGNTMVSYELNEDAKKKLKDQ